MSDKSYYAALSHSPVILKERLLNVARAEFLGRGQEEARKQFADVLRRTMALADVLGRKRILDATFKAKGEAKFSAAYDSIVTARFGVWDTLKKATSHAFESAFEILLGREPVLAKSREEINKAYGLGQKFAVRKLPDQLSDKAAQRVTVRLWEKVNELGVKGRNPDQARRVLADLGNFTESYAETVYRTNLASAYTAGRFKMMQDEDVRAVTPAFEYSAVGDASTRKHHEAADGLIAGATDAVWDRISPPMGFNCRCDLRVVTIFELRDRKLVGAHGQVRPFYPATFRNAHPDKGFAISRPDRRIYASS